MGTAGIEADGATIGATRSPASPAIAVHPSTQEEFLRNCWYVAAFGSELDAGDFVARRVLGIPLLLYRTASGDAVALHDQCAHRLVPLSLGRRVDDSMRCSYHGMVFGPDGRCTHIPGQSQIAPGAFVQRYPAVERHGHVWIWPGDPVLAEPQAIPNIPWAELDGWEAVRGYMSFAADYRLLTDNLLDLSHESYVHERTIGNHAAETIADYPVRVTIGSGSVLRAEREMLDIEPPPWFARVLGNTNCIDRWQTAIWAAPSINITDTAVAPAGSGRANAAVGRILHLLTPETSRSTHYFWSVNRNYAVGDKGMSDAVCKAICDTFEEDRSILEQQQRRLDETGLSVPQLALKVDDAPLRARRLLTARLRGEAAGEVCLEPFMMPGDPAPPGPDDNRH